MQNKQYKNFTINIYNQLESTNNLAFDLAKENKIHHQHIILSKSQTSGKGRYERVWQSPPGNLYFSILLKPQKNLQEISLLSFVACVSMGQAIADFDNQKNLIQYKWPNDILINSKKICGILLESDFAYDQANFVIVGIGVNIDSYPENTIYPASSLKQENIICDVENLLEKFLDHFADLYQNWQNYGFKNIRNLWLKNAFNINKIITVNLQNQKISGLFRDFDEKGNLVLEMENKKIVTISAGEIYN